MQKQEEERLRQQADSISGITETTGPENLPAEELNRLLTELRLKQAELEKQHEQLRITTREMHDSQKKFEDLYRFAPIGYITIDEAGQITEANQMAASLLGLGKFLNMAFAPFVAPDARNEFNAFFKKVMETGQKQQTELRLRTAGNDFFYALLDGLQSQNYKKQKFCHLTIINISDLKHAEAELRKSQAVLENSQRIARLGSWEYCLKSGKMIWSDEVYRLYGYEPGAVEPSFRIFEACTLPEDLHLINGLTSVTIPAGGELTFSRRIKDARGNLKYLQTIAKRETNSNEDILIGAVQDITSLKKAENELKEKEHFLNQVADATPDMIYVFDLENLSNVYMNKQVIRILGFTPEQVNEMAGDFLVNLVHPDDMENCRVGVEAILKATDNDLVQMEYRLRSAWGEYRWIRARQKVFKRNAAGIPCQLIGISQDVTSGKAFEEELRVKNKIINGMASNLPIIISIVQPNGLIHDLTGSGLRILNIKPDEFIGASIKKLFPEAAMHLPELKQEVITGFESFIPTRKGMKSFQTYFFYDQDSDSAIGLSIDITPQKEAEQLARTQKEFSESMLDNSVDGILAFDQELRVTAWNKVLERHSRYQRKEVLGKYIFELFPTLTETDIGLALQKVLKGERVILLNETFGLRFGEFEVYLNPLFNNNNNNNNNSLEIAGGMAILHDVTVRNRMEVERTAERLEQEKEMLNVVLQTQEDERRRIAEILHNSLGQLLYGVKLNFEQITGMAARMPDDLKEPATNISKLLDEAIREVRTISFELMPTILEDFGLAVATNELCKKLSTASLKFSCFSQNFDKRLSKSVEIILYRIIQELINNVIRHANASEATIHLVRTKKNILISVEDNGEGIDQTMLKAYKGGIGLKSIRSQLRLINATMNIDSTPQKGSSFTIKMSV